MSTSKTYQQSLADAGSETRPPMLERVSKLETAEDLQGDALLHYDVEIELMNLILLSIPNDIYNSVDACTSAKEMWKRVKGLMRGTIQNNVDRVTRFTNKFDPFIAEPGEALVFVYNRFAQLMNDLETNDMHFPIVTINTKFLNSLKPEWLKYVTQVRLAKRLTVDTVNIQSRNSGNTGRNNRRAYVQEEVVEGSNALNETQNIQRTLRTSSLGNTSTDEAGVILTDKHNDFLFADALRMGEIKELRGNICLIARIQPADNLFDAGPSHDSIFLSEVQSSSINENKEKVYPNHTKINNITVGDYQTGSNITFDSSNGNVNSGSVEKDTHVPDLCALEQLARNAYQEAKTQQIFVQKVQKQNMTLTSQLELYKERVQVLENINGDNNYLNEFLEVDQRAKHFSQQA
ncbi:hypothetical protein Tco_1282826 [Tanacetum coccineum]